MKLALLCALLLGCADRRQPAAVQPEAPTGLVPADDLACRRTPCDFGQDWGDTMCVPACGANGHCFQATLAADYRKGMCGTGFADRKAPQ